MTRSCTYDNPPMPNTGDLHVTDKGGFKGQLSEMIYFNRTLSPNEIYWIYRRGYQTFSLYDQVAKITPKVNVSVSGSGSASVGDNEVSGSASVGN